MEGAPTQQQMAAAMMNQGMHPQQAQAMAQAQAALHWGPPPNKRMQKILQQLHKMWKKKHQARRKYVTLEKAYNLMTQEFMLGQAADYIVHFGICGVAYC